MAYLFELPKYEPRTFTLSADMKTIIEAKLMDESQVKKFDRFPELLAVELENEQQYPDISNLEKDIFKAVYENDFVKFLRCVARVGYEQQLLARIYNWLLGKEDFTKRDLALLKRVEGARSVYNIFDY